jgi:hypothetical protein
MSELNFREVPLQEVIDRRAELTTRSAEGARLPLTMVDGDTINGSVSDNEKGDRLELSRPSDLAAA